MKYLRYPVQLYIARYKISCPGEIKKKKIFQFSRIKLLDNIFDV